MIKYLLKLGSFQRMATDVNLKTESVEAATAVLFKTYSLHEDTVKEAFNSVFSDHDEVMTVNLKSNVSIHNVNTRLFRVFSPLLDSLLSATYQNNPQVILLPDFDEDCFHHLIQILSYGSSKITSKDVPKLLEIQSLANCLRIDMKNLQTTSVIEDSSQNGSNLVFSSCSQKLLEVPNITNPQI